MPYLEIISLKPNSLHNRRETSGGEKYSVCYQSIVLVLPTFTTQ